MLTCIGPEVVVLILGPHISVSDYHCSPTGDECHKIDVIFIGCYTHKEQTICYTHTKALLKPNDKFSKWFLKSNCWVKIAV